MITLGYLSRFNQVKAERTVITSNIRSKATRHEQTQINYTLAKALTKTAEWLDMEKSQFGCVASVNNEGGKKHQWNVLWPYLVMHLILVKV